MILTRRHFRRIPSNFRTRKFLQLAGLVALAAGLIGVSVAAVAWTSFGGMTAVWPTYALAIVAILRGPRSRLWVVGACVAFYLSLVAAVLFFGASLPAALGLAAINLAELLVALALLARFRVVDRDLLRPSALFAFLACAAVAAPAVAATVAAPLIALLSGESFIGSWWDYWAADALGVAILAPLGMVVTRERLTGLRTRHDQLVAAAFAVVLTGLCVYLTLTSGKLAMLAPIAVLVTLRFGVMGAAVTVLWVSALAIGLNLAGLGIVSDVGAPGFRDSLFQLQLSLTVLPLVTLPVAAVLAQRDRAILAAATAERARAAFLTNMSHEIRTPLNGVIGMAEILSRSPLSERDREIATTIRSSGQTLERLLSDVLDLARMESGVALLDDSIFALDVMAHDLAAETRGKLGDRPVDIVLDLGAGLTGARRGPELCVRQILRALLDNAVKVTRRGSITLSIQARDEDHIRFTVRDTGPGFDPAVAATLFAAFGQADGSLTRSVGGAGVGLSIVRHLVEDMQGELSCDSTPGSGAVFEVVLRLPQAEPAAIARPAAAVSPGTERAPRILMAEDHPANRQVVQLMLAQVDVELTMVENGAEAVAAFAATRFDLVLMDVQMPVMDGLTAVVEIRRLEAEAGRAPVPILMLTANALPEHRAASASAGANAHITKPVTSPVLIDAIERALAGEPMPANLAAA